jgi:hypothetical protein
MTKTKKTKIKIKINSESYPSEVLKTCTNNQSFLLLKTSLQRSKKDLRSIYCGNCVDILR